MVVSESDLGACPACGTKEVETDVDILSGVCQDCGLVHDGEGWANVQTDGIETDIDENESLSEESADWRNEVTVRDASDKQLVAILSKIDTATNRLRLSEEARLRAADIVIEAWKENLMHGRDREGVIGASLYLSCRELNDPRPTTTVASAVDAADDQLRNGYQVLLDELELYHDPPDASDYLSYLGEELRLTENSIEKASDLLSDQMIGGNPAGVAAGALYVVSRADENITLADAGEVAGVTKETVWRKARDLK